MASFEIRSPPTRELTGGDLLAQSLQALNVQDIFGLHGGHLDAFLMGCEFIGIRLIDTRHETVAVQAAEGYSKVTGKVGTCFVTANSGNGLPGLATAFADRSSIVCITSSPPLSDLENNSLQGSIDQVVVSTPLTKFAHRICHPEDIPRIVSKAFRTAISGPPGPVLLDFPIDVLFSPVHTSRISWGSITSPLPYLPGPHSEAVKEAVNLLREAKRPVIITGTGARAEKDRQNLLQFVEKTRTPLFSSPKYSGSVHLSHELHGGRASNLIALPKLGLPSPDLIILLGARTGMYLGGRSGAIIPKIGCKVIQVDIDGSEIGRTLPADLGIVSDVGQAVMALNAAIAESEIQASEEWVKAATSIKSLPSPYEGAPKEVDGRPHPYHAMSQLFKSLEPGAIVCTDGGECGSWAGMVAHFAEPSTVIASVGYLGFLGNGFGYALGCAIGAPDRQIINIQGDGSAGFHFMELDTYARFKLNIMTVVANNYCWGMSSNGQELIYGSKTPARPVSSLSPMTAYETVAKGLANESARVDNIDEIESTVKRLSSTPGPSCINLIISNQPTHPATEAMVSMSDDPNVIVVPYYDNLPRAYYK
ncbi:hypothetical protein FQN57_005680 [Myotisia sp. PD_48]|nr:hypothetical protein FQN57_005680 [Myotisia sp. PD_48]